MSAPSPDSCQTIDHISQTGCRFHRKETQELKIGILRMKCSRRELWNNERRLCGGIFFDTVLNFAGSDCYEVKPGCDLA